jgi:cytochrome b
MSAHHPADGEMDIVLVWDLPTRVFHWLLALSFAGAYVTAESERWRLAHVTFGYTLGGLIAFRLIWGLVGTRHARFASFVRGPTAVLRYLRSLRTAQPEHHAGHNPAGALAIVALLALGALLVFTGWSTYNDVGGAWLEELHEGVANLMLAVVLVHIAAVLLSGRLHHENLVRAMLTGRKQGTPAEGIRRPWRVLGVLLLAAVLAFWLQQWRSAQMAAAGAQYSEDHDD